MTDADGSLPSGQYTVTVNWGDQSSPYSFSITPSDPTSFSLGAATHTYTEYGPYTATVTVVDNAGNSSGPQSFTVNVADAALTGATGVNVGALAGVAFTNVPVATFTDQAGSDSNPNDLSATIDWGDGQPGSPDTARGDPRQEQGNTGVYTVEGSHTYAAAGSDAITVTINDKGGQTTTATAAATVGNTVWVSGNWVDDTNPAGPLTAGDTVAAPTGETAPNLGSGTLIYGVNAFSTIQDGVTNVDTGGTVYVLPGTYVENVTISKPLTLSGAGQTGSSATTIIPSFAGAVGGSTFAAGCSNLILVQSSNVTIEDLLLDGNNPSLAGQSGATTVNGINVDCAERDRHRLPAWNPFQQFRRSRHDRPEHRLPRHLRLGWRHVRHLQQHGHQRRGRPEFRRHFQLRRCGHVPEQQRLLCQRRDFGESVNGNPIPRQRHYQFR